MPRLRRPVPKYCSILRNANAGYLSKTSYFAVVGGAAAERTTVSAAGF